VTSISYVFELRHPPKWGEEELKACLELLAQGGAVDIRYASVFLPEAVAVALALHENEIVGLAAIKKQRDEYAAQISTKSAFQLPSGALELGYVVVSKHHRGHGLATALVERVVSIATTPLFATTYDPAMLRIFNRQGFCISGQTWKARGSETLRLLFKDLN